MIFVAITFAAVLTIVVGAYWAFVLRSDLTEHKVLAKRMRPADVARRHRLTVSGTESRPSHSSILGKLQSAIIQADYKITPAGALVMCILSGFLLGLPVWQVGGHTLTIAVAVLAGLPLPYMWIRRAGTRRMWKFEEQFPEAIEQIARALRAGHAFTTGISMVAEEMAAPVGPEFKLLYDRQNFGLPLPDALRAFAERVPVIDARFFVTAVLTQRESGGNLSGVLDNLAAVIRERFRVKRQVRVVSAHGRITALVLFSLPPFIAFAQLVVAPNNMKIMITDPLGLKMLIAAGVLQGIGMLVIRKLVKVEY